GRDVGPENEAPRLQAILPRVPASPAAEAVDKIIELLRGSAGLMSCVQMNLYVVEGVAQSNLHRHPDQLFGLAVLAGLLAVSGFHFVIALLELVKIHFSQKVVQPDTKAAYLGDSFQFCLLFRLSRHGIDLHW